MNFFERIRTGRLFSNKKKEPEQQTTTDAGEITSSIPDLVVKFMFMDKTYILEDFELNFNQEMNAKGQPGGFPRGGIMTMILNGTPDYNINEWMLREELRRDGEIFIYPMGSKINEGALLSISFKDAYCIRYKKCIDTLGAGSQTTLVVSPRSIKIGKEEFENSWKKQESLSHYIRSQ